MDNISNIIQYNTMYYIAHIKQKQEPKLLFCVIRKMLITR